MAIRKKSFPIRRIKNAIVSRGMQTIREEMISKEKRKLITKFYYAIYLSLLLNPFASFLIH